MTFTAREAHLCRNDFPSLRRTARGRALAYLDGPAGTQVPQPVLEAITAYYQRSNANTHGAFVTSQESDAVIRETRETVATFLGAGDWRSISFGQNMTTLTFSLAHALAREIGPGDEVVITQLDHEANRGPWLLLEERGAVVREIAITPDGRLDGEDLSAKITDRTRLVAVGFASNAFGTVNDVGLVRELSRRVGAYLVVDAVHYAPHLPLDVAALDPDFLLCSAYKFYGPHVGILYCRPGLLDHLATDRLRTQEPDAPERIETGTLNHAALAGVKAAIEYVASWGEGEDLRSRVVSAMEALADYEHALARDYWQRAQEIPGVTVWGPDFSTRRAPTVSITVEGVPPREVARRLGDLGLCVWDGHFYAVRPMAVLGLAEAGGVVRVGVSMYNIQEEIERLLSALEGIAASAP